MKDKLDFPTRRSVEALFRELSRKFDSREWLEYKKVGEEIEALEKRLLNVSAMRSLVKRRDELYQRFHNVESKREQELNAVRRAYLANGLTPEVLQKVRDIVRRVNGGTP